MYWMNHLQYCSVGKKCMEEGYSFVWPANGAPYMISPDNKKILLECRGQHTSYVVKDNATSFPRTIDEQTESIDPNWSLVRCEIIDHEVHRS